MHSRMQSIAEILENLDHTECGKSQLRKGMPPCCTHRARHMHIRTCAWRHLYLSSIIPVCKRCKAHAQHTCTEHPIEQAICALCNRDPLGHRPPTLQSAALSMSIFVTMLLHARMPILVLWYKEFILTFLLFSHQLTVAPKKYLHRGLCLVLLPLLVIAPHLFVSVLILSLSPIIHHFAICFSANTGDCPHRAYT
jgi:hypothetical protein